MYSRASQTGQQLWQSLCQAPVPTERKAPCRVSTCTAHCAIIEWHICRDTAGLSKSTISTSRVPECVHTCIRGCALQLSRACQRETPGRNTMQSVFAVLGTLLAGTSLRQFAQLTLHSDWKVH